MPQIGVLTSGGDAPGMNAAIRAVVRAADAAGIGTYGIHDGYAGLLEGRLSPLDARAVSGILHLGGTQLGTARSERFREPAGRQEALEHLHAHDIDALVVIGGDGSFRGADLLAQEGGIRVVGIPGTIDNDLSGTDFTIGFDTAVNTALELIDRIRDTAASHGRLFFVEVMGRHSGWLALYSGLAGGATDILVPEEPTDVDDVRERIRASFELGKGFCLVIVAEGDDAGSAYDIAKQVAAGMDVDHRVTTLGHVQRGGSPTMRDRVLGSVLGDAAVAALLDGDNRVMVGDHRGDVIRSPLEQTWSQVDRAPEELLALMRRLAR
jgi:6-phosphofructokinase 1